MIKHNRSLVFALAALAALAPFAIDTYLPAFHVMAEKLRASDLEVQQSLTFYLMPYAFMTLFHGAISDAIGRITTIKWGLIVFALASLGCAFAPNIETLWMFRALQGASGGAGNTVARAMVRDLFEGAKAQKVMATVQMLFGIAPAVAPIIGGLLLGIHWQAIFIFLALYAVASLWAAIRLLPETMPPEKRHPLSLKHIIHSYMTLFKDMEFTKLVVGVGANFSAFFVYVLASPVFLGKHLGLSPHQYAYLFIPTVTGMMLGSFLVTRLAGIIASHRLLRFAYLWMILMAGMNWVICSTMPPHVIWNIVPVALFNIGMAIAMPILSVGALHLHPRIRGTAASGQAFIQMLLSTVSAGLIVPLVWATPSGLAATMCGYVLIGFIVTLSARLWHSSE